MERSVGRSTFCLAKGGLPVSLILDLKRQLAGDEGNVKYGYKDSLGYLTIGIGFLIDERKGGLRPEEIGFIFANRIELIRTELAQKAPWMSKLSEARQGAFLNMAYQLGVDGLLRFKNTLASAQAGEWDKVEAGVLASLYAKQTPNRARRIAKQLQTNVWQFMPGS